MRKPFYRKDRQAWYVRVDGGKSQIRLHEKRKEAHELWARMVAAAEHHRGPMAVGDIAAQFLDFAERSISATTFTSYQYFIKDFCEAHGTETTATIKPLHVTMWLDAHKKWGNGSRRGAIIAVKRMFSWAHGEGYIDRLPLEKVQRPAAERREAIISDDDHARIMQIQDGGRRRRDGAFRLFLIPLRLTGTRPGNVARVTSADVTDDGKTWTLKQHKNARKTGKPLVIFLPPCLQTLTQIILHFRPRGRLFLNSKKQPWTKDAIRNRMAKIRVKLKLPAGIVAYSYRHTFITRALERGESIADVAQITGTSATMIERHYGHLEQRKERLLLVAQRITSNSATTGLQQ